MSFVVSIVKGLFVAEVDDPAVRRALRALEAAVISAAVVYLQAHGVPFIG